MLLWKIIPGVILLAAVFNARSVQGLKSATMEQRSVAVSGIVVCAVGKQFESYFSMLILMLMFKH